MTIRRTTTGSLELVQHRLSWYPEIGLDLTLGVEQNVSPAAGWHGLGTRLNPVEAADCFGCHVAWLPKTNGHFDESRLITGVQCTRCHINGAEHVHAVETGQTLTKPDRWSELTPLDSIRRCGECHRRDDHFTARELRSNNLSLIRFAPVGLSQSRCFVSQRQTTSHEHETRGRFDCLTCHNPHRPAETRSEFYVKRCLNCHGHKPGMAAVCSAQKTSQQCLECHMPKIEVQPHLRFTDHWIRKPAATEE